MSTQTTSASKESTQRFVLAVNYWPRNKAMYWWKDFERAEVEKEFEEIRNLGIDVVRIFLLWEDFQPSPDRIDEQTLHNLGSVLDIAQSLEIQVMPTFFTGHMSGVNWWPEWAVGEGTDTGGMRRVAGGALTERKGRNPYGDPFLLQAEQHLLSTICSRYDAHPAVYSWNLGNEPDLFALPESYDEGEGWVATMAAAIRANSDRPVSLGTHIASLTRYTGFRIDRIAPYLDYLSMHAYSIYYPLTRDSDPMNSDVVPLACLVTEALGGKPVLLEEFGYASAPRGQSPGIKTLQLSGGATRQYFANDAKGGHYYQEVMAKLLAAGALGAGAWMFSDYATSLWNRPPFDTYEHERFFGITYADGEVKPSGQAMQDLAEELRHQRRPARTLPRLHIDPDAYYADPRQSFDALFQDWNGKLKGEKPI